MRWAILPSALSYCFARRTLNPRGAVGKLQINEYCNNHLFFVSLAFETLITKSQLFVDVTAREAPSASKWTDL